MLTLTLQDWTTLRGTDATAIVQTASGWLDLEAYADVVFWLEVSEVTNPSGGNVSILYETSPSNDESLFQTLGSVGAVTVGGPTITKAMMNAAVFAPPLGRFVRWKVQATASAAWDLTFRIQASVGMGVVGSFTPLQLPGLALWLRADQGVTLTTGKVSAWADQSGNGNNVVQATGANQPTVTANGIGGRPAINFSGSTFMTNSSANIVAAPGNPYSVLTVAKQGSGALFALRRTNQYSATMFLGTNTFVHGDGVNAFANITIANSSAITNGSSPFKSCHAFNGAGTWPGIYLNAANQLITSGAPPVTKQTTEGGTTGFVVASDASSQFWGGLISEIIVCTGSISEFYRKKVEGYQRDFFGV